MTKIKKETIEETVVETVEPIVEEKVEEKTVETVVESAEKAAFRLFIENYKISNPVKYEGKKDALEKQLNEIK
jgi:hypothetical protein